MGSALPWEPLHTTREERTVYRDGERRGRRCGKKRSKLRIHGQLFSFQLKHRARKNLNKESGRVGKHPPSAEWKEIQRKTPNSISLRPTLFLLLLLKHTHTNQTVRQRNGVQTRWWLHWLRVHVFSSPCAKLIGHSLKLMSKQRHCWLCVRLCLCKCVSTELTRRWPEHDQSHSIRILPPLSSA